MTEESTDSADTRAVVVGCVIGAFALLVVQLGIAEPFDEPQWSTVWGVGYVAVGVALGLLTRFPIQSAFGSAIAALSILSEEGLDVLDLDSVWIQLGAPLFGALIGMALLHAWQTIAGSDSAS
ncbi:MAG: hypothetical protein ACYTGQ_19590 [Planctomycetota bacterium]|jgi:hypothetical protein